MYVLMINVVVVRRGIHHLLQVMVIGDTHGYVVRVGLTEISLGIVGHIVTVLIIIQQIGSRRIFYTIDMTLGFGLRLEQLPTTTRQLVGTWCHVRILQADGRTRQHNLWRQDVLYVWHTTLELDMNVHHMALADRRDVTVRIALFVVVLIDDGDNLILRQVIDIRLAAHIEC